MDEKNEPEAFGHCTECTCPYYQPKNDYEKGACVNTHKDSSEVCGHSFDAHTWTE